MSRKRTLITSGIVMLFWLVSIACGALKPTSEVIVQSEMLDEELPAPTGLINQPIELVEKEEEFTAAAPMMEMEGGLQVMPTLAPANDKPYIDSFFENYGVNPMIDTEDDHFSTFALDVDTGSYTIARRFLGDGILPDKNSVRVEEYINYFDQDYSLPPEGKAFVIHIDGSAAPFTENEKYTILRVGLQGYAIPPEERKDVSLTFVIDVSGSMDMENRLELVKDSLALLVSQLGARDKVSIVVYGSEAHTILEPTPGDRKETITNAINALHPEGSTNTADGIRMGYKMALQGFNSNGINRVILCSDGVANVGNTGAESIWESVEAYASEGVTLTTIGFGMGNYNDVLMEQLANMGDGFYAYVDNIKEAERLFITNLTSTLQVIARDAKVQVDFNPEVVARYRLIGFENRAIADEDFRDDTVDAGEIGAGHSVTALYEIKLHPEADGEIANVYLRWEDPDTREVIEINKTFNSDQQHNRFSDADEHFQWDVIVAEFADILRESYWAQNSTLAGVQEEVERIGRMLADDPDVVEFVEMVRTANMITQDQ